MAPRTAVATSGAAAAASALPSGAAAAATAASSSSAEAFAVLAATGSRRAREVSADIDALLRAQKRAREEKRRLQADLKNARRRRNRLTKKARQLSTEDLLTVVAMREADVARRSADAAPAALADAVVRDLEAALEDEDRFAAAPLEAQNADEREE